MNARGLGIGVAAWVLVCILGVTAPAEESKPVEPAADAQATETPAPPVAAAATDAPATPETPPTPPTAEPAVPETPVPPPAAEPAAIEAPMPAPAEAGPASTNAAAQAEEETIRLNLEPMEIEGAEVQPGATRPELLSVSLDNVPLQEVVRLFTRVSGANIVAGTNLQGNVTVSLKDVEWAPALRVILDQANLIMIEKAPNIYSIVSKRDLADAPLTAETIFLRFTTASNVMPVIRQMCISSNASVMTVASANALVVQETPARIGAIKEVVARVDRPRPQVFIEAKFVELNDEAIKDIGINWQVLEGYTVKAGNLSWGVTESREWNKSRKDTKDQEDSRENIDALNTSYDVDNQESTAMNGPSTVQEGENTIDGTVGRVVQDSIVKTFDVKSSIEDSYAKKVTDLRTANLSADDFALTLSALKQNNGVSIVSNPKIVVASGQTATIHVGTQEPQIRSEYNSDSKTTVYTLDRYIDVGVLVYVTPVVNTESNISVRIIPELSRKLSDVPAGDGTVTFPRLSTRSVLTDFDLESGRTVAIGGLTSTEDREEIKKIPILGSIPVLGKYLFSHTHTKKVQDEVIIFVTVSLARAHVITESAGIPSEGKLIYRHLNKQADKIVAKKNAREVKPRVGNLRPAPDEAEVEPEAAAAP